MIAFTASWCGPCKNLKPFIDKLERFGATVERVDIDEQENYAKQFDIQSVPTIVFVEDGIEFERLVNPRPMMMKDAWDEFESPKK